MAYHQAFNPKINNTYGRNHNIAQSDKNMKFYGVLGEKKMNFIQEPYMSSSPNYLNQQKNKQKNYGSANAYSNSQFRILDMQQNQSNIRKGNFPQIKNNKQFPSQNYDNNRQSDFFNSGSAKIPRNTYKSDISLPTLNKAQETNNHDYARDEREKANNLSHNIEYRGRQNRNTNVASNSRVNNTKKNFGINAQSIHPTHHESAPILNHRSNNHVHERGPTKLQPSKLFTAVSVRTRPGFNGYTLKTNQDSFVVDKCFDNNDYHAFIGCFDGHGQFGHKVSQFIKRTITFNMINKIKQKFTSHDLKLEADEDIAKLLIDCFVYTNADLNSKLSSITELSGSTGVGVLIYNNKFYCANVGDSEAGLQQMGNDGGFHMQMLSKCHLPDQPEERERIKKVGGRIEAYRLPDGSHIGPPRVWKMNEDIPGLMMSRTFGDRVGHACGISDVPEIIHAQKNSSHKALVVGSDGVWEVLTKPMIAAVCSKWQKTVNSDAAADELQEKATNKWRAKANYRDDITVVVAYQNTEPEDFN